MLMECHYGPIDERIYTIKGGSRRAEKSRKVLLMMMKAAKLGWAEPGAEQEQGRNRSQRTALLFSPKLAPKPNLIKIG